MSYEQDGRPLSRPRPGRGGAPGLSQVAGDRERLAQAEPDRADYQRDLSVSYEQDGRPLSAPSARARRRARPILKSLAIAERLAAAEPDRADYQRDLSVSYEQDGRPLWRPRPGRGGAPGLPEVAGDQPSGWRRPSRIAPTTSATSRCRTRRWATCMAPSARARRRERPIPKSLAIAERLAQAEPDRADYQRDLSVSYERMGDLYGALGQGEEARQAYLKSLAIRERLAEAEPDRADYQRDLSVSYERMGDLYRRPRPGRGGAPGLSQVAGDQRAAGAGRARSRRLPARPLGVVRTRWATSIAPSARARRRARPIKSLAIAERLAQAEPDRADYQRDLSVSYEQMGDLYRALGQGDEARQAYLKSLAIESGWRRPSPIAPTTSATSRCRTTRWATCFAPSARARRRARPMASRWRSLSGWRRRSPIAPTTSAT